MCPSFFVKFSVTSVQYNSQQSELWSKKSSVQISPKLQIYLVTSSIPLYFAGLYPPVISTESLPNSMISSLPSPAAPNGLRNTGPGEGSPLGKAWEASEKSGAAGGMGGQISKHCPFLFFEEISSGYKSIYPSQPTLLRWKFWSTSQGGVWVHEIMYMKHTEHSKSSLLPFIWVVNIISHLRHSYRKNVSVSYHRNWHQMFHPTSKTNVANPSFFSNWTSTSSESVVLAYYATANPSLLPPV